MRKKILFCLIFLFRRNHGLSRNRETEQQHLERLIWESQPRSKEIVEISTKAGQNLTITCPINTSWSFPNHTNREVDGYDFDEFQKRFYIEETEENTQLTINDLQPTDTGLYQCADSGNFSELGSSSPLSFYVFVKGSNLFLKPKRKEIYLTTGSRRNIIIPCRTTAPIDVTKMKLFVDDEQWFGLCTDTRAVQTVLDNNVLINLGTQHKDIFDCMPTFAYYSARDGFNFGTLKTPFQVKQIDEKRFRCEYETSSVKLESVEFSALIHGILYDDARKLLGEDELYCVFKNLTFGFFAVHNKVEFGCFSCDSKENEILFHKLNDELKKRESLPDFTHVTAGKDVFHFCNWLELLMEQSETSPVLDPNQNPINSFAAWIILLCMSFSIIIILVLWVWKRNCVQEKSSFNGKQMDENLEMLNITNPTGPTFEESEIGNGAHGRVVVLKGYPEPAVKKILTSKDPQYLDRFKQEFEFLKALKHPHVVKLIQMQLLEGNEKFEIIMEHCQRGDLSRLLLDPTIVYSMKMVITWGEQLFDAVHYMYREKSVVHRDIKPDNIFVTMSFDLKIGDFGLAKHIEKTCVGSCVGTHRYMSPSQDSNESQQASHRNDVYGLGLVLWEIVERRVVFSEYGSKGMFNTVNFLSDIIHKKLERLSKPNCPEQLQAIIERCANFDREARPKASEILHQILFIKKEDVFIKALKFLIDQTEQTTIFRPIGFDRTEERVPIDGMTSSYHDLLPHHA